MHSKNAHKLERTVCMCKVTYDPEKWKQLIAEQLGKLSNIHSMAYYSLLKGASEECLITFY